MNSKIKKFRATLMALMMALTPMALNGCASNGDPSQGSGFQANPFFVARGT